MKTRGQTGADKASPGPGDGGETAKWGVDLDLEAFFDRVNHDRLMSRLGPRIADRRVLWITRRFLQAGVRENAVFSETTEGTPQGGPRSPLLANLVRDELDRELERRGLRFVRYADDGNIYLRSERAAANAFENLIGFIEGRLKLTVNRAQSAVARPWERKLLGFSFTRGANAKRRIAPKALAKAKERIRELTKKGRSDFQSIMAELRRYLLGETRRRHRRSGQTGRFLRRPRAYQPYPIAQPDLPQQMVRRSRPTPLPSLILTSLHRTAGCGPACPVV
jgi:hypothetical protein